MCFRVIPIPPPRFPCAERGQQLRPVMQHLHPRHGGDARTHLRLLRDKRDVPEPQAVCILRNTISSLDKERRNATMPCHAHDVGSAVSLQHSAASHARTPSPPRSCTVCWVQTCSSPPLSSPPDLHSATPPQRYVRSHIDLQLAGKGGWSGYVNDETQAQSCSPLVNVPGNSSLEINPCGLVAWSFFNDSYSVGRGPGGSWPGHSSTICTRAGCGT
jgi:hypothetical protein